MWSPALVPTAVPCGDSDTSEAWCPGCRGRWTGPLRVKTDFCPGSYRPSTRLPAVTRLESGICTFGPARVATLGVPGACRGSRVAPSPHS